MKKKVIYIFIVLLGIYVFNSFFTNSMVTGVYVNRNYENDFIAENPHVADTLIIKENYQIESSYWGNGSYKLEYTPEGTNITLKGNGNSIHTYIRRKYFFGNPKIILFEDLDQYYEKIE
ncbi:hypothetical protein ACI6PS_02140 [Flavobacterium sp. PLA-1-15]|uniref:hypothetical protein n=1 Tax=Flavobacterium sp. PLA-1-15 TaxID=3380533 RepID=UPI003B7D78D0